MGRTGITLVSLLCAVACGPSSSQPTPPEDLNVLLIVIDTFGAEHAGSFMNADLAHTPNLDRLAERGVVFRNAYAPAPWTKPSVASLFTAVMPSRHGLRRPLDTLHEDWPTLAELLQGSGFATGSVISNFLLAGSGFDRGFDSYDTSPVGGQDAITSKQVTDLAIAWLHERVDEQFFLLVYYFDPHFKYQHHPSFDRTSSYRGSLAPGMPIWGLRARRAKLESADIAYLVGLHREEIAFTDFHVGRLLDRLRELGLDRRTLAIVTSDHGEEFMRHGWIGHTRTLYDELLHVPMIVALPGTISPDVVDEPVSLLDVVPTVLELAGASELRQDWDGISLAARLLGQSSLSPDRKIPAEVSFFALIDKKREKIAFKTSLLSRRHKVIHDLQSGSWELYDLAADPEELNDLIGRGHPSEPQLTSELEAWEASRHGTDADSPDVALDEELIERLRGLGYVE